MPGYPRPLPFRLRFALALLVGGCGWTAGGLRSAPIEPAGPLPGATEAAVSGQLTQLGQFWVAPVEQREVGLPYDFEVDVLYYDPNWRILQVADDSLAEFIHCDQPAPIASGQRVRITGRTVPPVNEFWLRDATFTVLGPARSCWVPVDLAKVNLRAQLNQPIEFVGLFESHGFDGADHMRLRVISGGYAVTVWVLVDPLLPVPDYTGRILRVRGVEAARFDANGAVNALDVFCPGVTAVEVVASVATAPEFDHPVTTVNELIVRPRQDPVHVLGTVVKAWADGELTVRDATGQVVVETAQRASFPLGSPVEVWGYPQIQSVAVRLTRAWVRSPPTLNDHEERATDPSQLHRSTASVLELTPEGAARGEPVEINGVVTWSSPRSMFYFLQDSTGGIAVYRQDPDAPPPAPGRHVALEGEAAQGDFAPMVREHRIKDLGALALPRPKAVTLEQALTGVEEAQWVEMTGFVHRVRRDGPWARLDVSTSAGPLTARLPADSAAGDLVGAVVSLRGVCTAMTDERRKLSGIDIWVTDLGNVEVLDSGQGDLFDLPVSPLSELGRFSTASNLRRRIKVRGTVLHWSPTDGLYLAEGNDRLLVHTRQEHPPQPGDVVEAVGFHGHEGGRTVLREGRFRVLRRGTLPLPLAVETPGTVQPELDGRLVTVTGQVLERFRAGNEARLALQNGRSVFEVELEGPNRLADMTELPAERAAVAVTGVYAVIFDDRDEGVGFRVLVGDPAQVVVVAQPEWWTRERFLLAVGLLLTGVTLALARVRLLQRRVTAQAIEINDQIRRATKLEADLQRASRLESLGTLAGGIAHDFNNLLTVVMGNVALAALDEKLGDETRARLDDTRLAAIRARDLTHRLITFAKGGAPVRSAFGIEELLREEAEDYGVPDDVKVTWQVADDCGAVWADPRQIRQVVQNLLLNALQAMPRGGALQIAVAEQAVATEQETLLQPGRYVRVSIRDNGEGIAAKNLPRIFDPYFTTREGAHGLGLAVVYSIVRRHNGMITIDSTPMVGTVVELWLPVATDPVRPGSA